MATDQEELAVSVPIKPEKLTELRALLKEIGSDVEGNAIIPFAKLTTVHFARWVILDEAKDIHGTTIPPRLFFSTNYDAPLEQHLDELLRIAGAGLDRIYSHCEWYPTPEERAPDSTLAYIRSHEVTSSTFYVGTPGRSVQQIRGEARLRDTIEEFLDQGHAVRRWVGQDPETVRRAIQAFVASEPTLSEALEPAAPRPMLARLGRSVVKILRIVGEGIRVVFAGLLLLLGAIPLRILEARDTQNESRGDHPHARRLTEREDHVVQNQMTSVTDIKAGWFRQFVLSTVFLAIQLLARYWFTKGNLAGIPSIHFARWIVIDRGRRLLFLSNFDGSWESYLGDFVDKAAGGLTAIWSNTVGFPRSFFLLWKGARTEQLFKGYTRDSQLPTEVWYSAYRNLSVQNINNNSKIREGLRGDLSPKATLDWLQRL